MRYWSAQQNPHVPKNHKWKELLRSLAGTLPVETVRTLLRWLKWVPPRLYRPNRQPECRNDTLGKWKECHCQNRQSDRQDIQADYRRRLDGAFRRRIRVRRARIASGRQFDADARCGIGQEKSGRSGRSCRLIICRTIVGRSAHADQRSELIRSRTAFSP